MLFMNWTSFKSLGETAYLQRSARDLQCKCLLILIKDFLNTTGTLTPKLTEALSLTISQNQILATQTWTAAVFK